MGSGKAKGQVRIFRPGLSALMICCPALCWRASSIAVEDGVVFDFRHQQQAGFGDLERVARAGQGNGDHLRVVEGEGKAESPPSEARTLSHLRPGGLEAVRQFVEHRFGLREAGFGNLLLDDQTRASGHQDR